MSLIQNKKMEERLTEPLQGYIKQVYDFFKSIFIFLLVVFLLVSCKGQEKDNIIQAKQKIEEEKQQEIFIGKTFFEGDELNNYLFIKSENLINIDSLSYTIYRKEDTKDYIFSLEKFIKNDDVKKYLIIDVINFKDYDSLSFSVKESYIKEKWNLIFLQKNKVLKQWAFEKKMATQTIESLKLQLDKYKIKKELKCDLNKDGQEDIILIFEPKVIKKMDLDNSLLMDSPLYIMINKGNNSYSIISNNNIIYTASYNCPSDGLKKITSEDNYFTIEQVTCDEFGRIQNDNITFEYNNKSDELTLAKFKRSLFERSDGSEFLPISSFLYPKDFGKIDFKNYDSKIKYENIEK